MNKLQIISAEGFSIPWDKKGKTHTVKFNTNSITLETLFHTGPGHYLFSGNGICLN